MPGDGREVERAENEREWLDAIGPEIERGAMRRQFRNFIALLAGVVVFMLCAYWVWKFYLGAPTIPFVMFGPTQQPQ